MEKKAVSIASANSHVRKPTAVVSNIRQWARESAFNPGFVGILINPFFLLRRALFTEISNASRYVCGKVLDVGCGEKPYQGLFFSSFYIGVEIAGARPERKEAADLLYDGARLPFGDSTFDSVVCSEVLEHVADPEGFMLEIGRVLRPGGRVLLTVPFLWPEHEQPRDFGRYSSFGIRNLSLQCGFVVISSVKALSGVGAICQLLAALAFGKFRRRGRWVARICTPLFIAPLSAAGLLLSARNASDSEFYIGNVVILKKVLITDFDDIPADRCGGGNV